MPFPPIKFPVDPAAPMASGFLLRPNPLPAMKLLLAALTLTAALAPAASPVRAASYTTSWLGNTGETQANYVGNGARSLWVSPEGVVYTASMWDENGRNIGVYQNGAVIGAMGGTRDSQGSAIGGDATSIFTAQQSSGKIGRYNRATQTRDLLFTASNATAGRGGDILTGIAVGGGLVYVSDFPGNRVRVFTTDGAFQREWTVAGPGALALENDGAHLWVACKDAATLRRYTATGAPGTVIRLPAASRPSALHINARDELWVGDQGPDMDIKIYTRLDATPVQSGTFGVRGGYLSETGGLRGQAGPLRFTRVVGIGSDQAGHVYVLNNPWGGSTDLGRDAPTDLHCYDRKTGAQQWALQALNFEGLAAPDPGTDGAYFYGTNILYAGSGQAGYKANTVDPFRYPDDARIDTHGGRFAHGEHFAQLACVGGKRILLACGQNPDRFFTYYFNPATDGLIAIPGRKFGGPPLIRNGFALASNGDLWIGFDKTNAIQRYPLIRFAPNGEPVWGPPVSTPTPASLGRLNRIEYLPPTDTMILAGGSPDWVLMGSRVEVYRGWLAGNRTPDTVITLRRAQAKAMAAAGAYLFVGYYAVNNIDVFDLSTGALVLTMTASDGVDPGNDVDSMYGLRAYQKTDGRYLVTKDDYNHSKIVVYTFTP